MKSGEKLKGLFIGGVSGRDELAWGMATALEKIIDLEPYFLSPKRKNYHFFITHNVPENRIVSIDLDIQEDMEIDREFLNEIEGKYGDPNLFVFWPSIRKEGGIKYDNALKIFQYLFGSLEEILERVRPHFIVTDAIAALPLLVLQRVAEYRKIQMYILDNSRIPDHFVIRLSYKNKWPEMEKSFEELKGRELSSLERTESEDFLKKFRTKGLSPTYSKLIEKRVKKTLPRIKSVLRSFYEVYRFGLYKRTYKSAMNIFMPFNYVLKKLMHDLRGRYLKLSNVFETPDYSEKFVLFPLHIQPEASTLIWAPFFVNQLEVVNSLAKSVPVDYKVYVKEHRANFGNRGMAYYRELKKNPNVKILAPWENTQKLIQKSSIVVTITGTVGWESILWEKPVITMGNVFFNAFDHVRQITDYTKLPAVIKEILNNYKPDRELMLKFIAANILSSYPGVPLTPYTCNYYSMSEDNLNSLARGIAGRIKKDFNDFS